MKIEEVIKHLTELKELFDLYVIDCGCFENHEETNPCKHETALTTAISVLKRADDKVAIHNIFCKDCNVMDCEEADKYTQAIVNYLTEKSNDPKE